MIYHPNVPCETGDGTEHWEIVPLGSKVIFLSGGTPSKDEPKYWGGEIPWVSSGEMTQRRIINTQLKVTDEGANQGTKRIPPNTVLIVVRGMSLAREFRVAISKRELTFNQDLKALRPSKDLDSEFLFYYLLSQSNAIRDSASEAAHGTKKLDIPVLEQWPIPLPPIQTQKKIAAILSAYDDLIENNKRRIELLEKMAEEIYREWFVRMRFPGHEKVKFEKGVPSNWIFTKLGEIANFTMGQSPKSEFYNETGDGLPFNQGVGTYGERFPKKITYCTSNGRKAKKGDILFSVRAPVGRLNIADCEMIIGRGLAAISHKQGFNSYLFYLLKIAFSDEDIIGNGAIFNSVSKDELAKFNVLQPDHNLVLKYNKIVSDIDKQIAVLTSSLKNLASVRDLLLSRLISGKLSVENLDIQFPPSMLDEGHPAYEPHVATIAATG